MIRLFFEGPDSGDSLALFFLFQIDYGSDIDAILKHSLLQKLEDNLNIDIDCAFFYVVQDYLLLQTVSHKRRISKLPYFTKKQNT